MAVDNETVNQELVVAKLRVAKANKQADKHAEKIERLEAKIKKQTRIVEANKLQILFAN